MKKLINIILITVISYWCYSDFGSGSGMTDSSTNATVTIDHSHHEIHSGSHYKSGFGSVTQTLDTDDVIMVLFVSPDTTTQIHFTLTATATGLAKVQLFEGTTTTANGTAITRWNRYRDSTNTSTMLAFHTPTIDTDGSTFTTKYIGGSGFKTSIGGETRGSSEIILKRNTKYLIRGTALVDNMSIQLGGDWYEHTPKN